MKKRYLTQDEVADRYRGWFQYAHWRTGEASG